MFLITWMELNTILNLLINYNLTADELLLVYLTFLAQDEEGHPEYLAKWFSNGGSDRLLTLFESLKDKNIIHKNYNPSSYNPNDIEFNRNFIKAWAKNSGELGKELFDNYEPFLYIKGKNVPLRNIAKKFNSLEEFFFHYSSTIGHSIEKHKEVMELLKYGRENNLITYGILEFVISQKWNDIKYIRDNGLTGEIAETSDIYTE